MKKKLLLLTLALVLSVSSVFAVGNTKSISSLYLGYNYLNSTSHSQVKLDPNNIGFGGNSAFYVVSPYTNSGFGFDAIVDLGVELGKNKSNIDILVAFGLSYYLSLSQQTGMTFTVAPSVSFFEKPGYTASSSYKLYSYGLTASSSFIYYPIDGLGFTFGLTATAQPFGHEPKESFGSTGLYIVTAKCGVTLCIDNEITYYIPRY